MDLFPILLAPDVGHCNVDATTTQGRLTNLVDMLADHWSGFRGNKPFLLQVEVQSSPAALKIFLEVSKCLEVLVFGGVVSLGLRKLFLIGNPFFSSGYLHSHAEPVRYGHLIFISFRPVVIRTPSSVLKTCGDSCGSSLVPLALLAVVSGRLWSLIVRDRDRVETSPAQIHGDPINQRPPQVM